MIVTGSIAANGQIGVASLAVGQQRALAAASREHPLRHPAHDQKVEVHAYRRCHASHQHTRPESSMAMLSAVKLCFKRLTECAQRRPVINAVKISEPLHGRVHDLSEAPLLGRPFLAMPPAQIGVDESVAPGRERRPTAASGRNETAVEFRHERSEPLRMICVCGQALSQPQALLLKRPLRFGSAVLREQPEPSVPVIDPAGDASGACHTLPRRDRCRYAASPAAVGHPQVNLVEPGHQRGPRQALLAQLQQVEQTATQPGGGGSQGASAAARDFSGVESVAN